MTQRVPERFRVGDSTIGYWPGRAGKDRHRLSRVADGRHL